MNDMRQMTALGRSIEDGSFAIIDAEAGAHEFGAAEWQVVRRVIHATLAHVGGDKRVCAQLLGIATRTIYRRLEEERTDPDPAEAAS